MMGAPVEQNEQTNPVDQVEFDLPLQQEGPSAIPQTDRLGPNWEHPEGVDFAEVEYEYAPRVKSAHVIAYACGVIAMAAASIWLVMHAPERRPFGEWTWTAPALPDFSGMSTPQVPEALKRLPD